MDELARRLKPLGQVRLMKKGLHILFQSEVPRKAFLVREGIIRAYTINSSGEEAVAAFYTKGDVFPLPWLFGTTNNTLFYYDAVTDVQLLAVSREDFVNTVMKDKTLIKELFRFLNLQHTSLLLRITGLEQSRAIEKISYTFYYLLFRFGTETKPGIFRVDIRLSHLMLAELVGITRESTTKNLLILKKKGIITPDRFIYSINKKKLEDFIGEDAFRELIL